jgi:hypothetical protein
MLITLLDTALLLKNPVSRKENPARSKTVLEKCSFLCSKKVPSKNKLSDLNLPSCRAIFNE